MMSHPPLVKRVTRIDQSLLPEKTEDEFFATMGALLLASALFIVPVWAGVWFIKVPSMTSPASPQKYRPNMARLFHRKIKVLYPSRATFNATILLGKHDEWQFLLQLWFS